MKMKSLSMTLLLSAFAAAPAVAQPAGGMNGKPDDHGKMDGDHGMEGDHGMAAPAMDEATMQRMVAELKGGEMSADAAAAEQAHYLMIDAMVRSLAADPRFKQAAMAAMTRPEAADARMSGMKMMSDPEQAKKMRDEMLKDPATVKLVARLAAVRAAMGDAMTGGDHGTMNGGMDHAEPGKMKSGR
jgi:hypothetical protein